MTNVPYGLDEECLENRANEVSHYLWQVARAAVVAELGEDSEFVPGTRRRRRRLRGVRALGDREPVA